MAEAETAEEAPKKRKALPLLVGAGLAVLLGAAGFYATFAGLIGGGHAPAETAAQAAEPVPGGAGAFVALAPLSVSLGPGAGARHLRFGAELEVAPAHAAEVAALTPRVLDVLNSYLRALDVAEIEDPAALMRLRAHMLRRIQLVTGEGRVRDLLVTEFLID